MVQVEAGIVEELRSLGLAATPDNPTPRAPSFDELSNLKLLSCAVKETLRLIPVRSVTH